MVSIIFGLLVGFFLGKTLLEEYHSYNGIKTVNVDGISAYYIKYGEYDSLETLEKETLTLSNYIYTEKDGKFSVYIGITASKDNLDKILNYYKSLNYDVTTEEYFITNKDYINYLTNADKLIENTDDASVLNEVCSQILSKYEELVINDS